MVISIVRRSRWAQRLVFQSPRRVLDGQLHGGSSDWSQAPGQAYTLCKNLQYENVEYSLREYVPALAGGGSSGSGQPDTQDQHSRSEVLHIGIDLAPSLVARCGQAQRTVSFAHHTPKILNGPAPIRHPQAF